MQFNTARRMGVLVRYGKPRRLGVLVRYGKPRRLGGYRALQYCPALGVPGTSILPGAWGTGQFSTARRLGVPVQLGTFRRLGVPVRYGPVRYGPPRRLGC